MKIALFGIQGVYNYGCEAIIRGTEKIIHKKYPEAEIDYISLCAVEDDRRLTGCNIQVVPDFPNKALYYIRSGLNYTERNIFQKIPGYKRFLYKLKYSWVKNYDVILSIGGDIYTIGSSAGKDGPFYLNVIDMALAAKSKNVPVVIWGASIGPFEGYPIRKEIYFSHFNDCISYICAREIHTLNYLKNNGYNRCTFFPDPAFSVRDDINETVEIDGKICIGINLSPLSANTIRDKSTDLDIIHLQAHTIKCIVEKFEAEILLIPHVVSDKDESDDDYRYLLKIKHYLDKIGVNVEISPHDSNFIDIKKYISKCDIVLAARMHCAINSVTCGVPPFFLSYSEKSVGMCEVIYGNGDYVVPLKSFNDNKLIIDKLGFMIQNYKGIKEQVSNKSSRLEKEALGNIMGIDNVLR